MSYYPVFLDIRGRRCVVIGGGEIASRKAEMLLAHEGQVEVISPWLCPELTRLSEEGLVRTAKREYQHGDLEGAFVAIAATDDRDTNRRIADEANERGILVNVVDFPALCNFIVPSYVKRGDVTIAVSTNAKSPALARKIRTQLQQQFGEEYGELVLLLEEVRSELRENQVRIPPDAWQKALDLDTILDFLRLGMRDAAKKRIVDTLWETFGANE